MITYEQARQIALDYIGPDCALSESLIQERPYGWFFTYQSKRLRETNDPVDAIYGASGFLVEREGGHIILVSAPPGLWQRWFAWYEKGFKYESYDLTIYSIRDVEATVHILYSLRLTYRKPQEEEAMEPVAPPSRDLRQFYAILEIRSIVSKVKIQRVPHTFEEQWFDPDRSDLFEQINRDGPFVYQLTEHRVDGEPGAMVITNVRR